MAPRHHHHKGLPGRRGGGSRLPACGPDRRPIEPVRQRGQHSIIFGESGEPARSWPADRLLPRTAIQHLDHRMWHFGHGHPVPLLDRPSVAKRCPPWFRIGSSAGAGKGAWDPTAWVDRLRGACPQPGGRRWVVWIDVPHRRTRGSAAPMAASSSPRWQPPQAPSRTASADLVPLAVWPCAQTSAQYQRAGRYLPESSRHPGKMLPELARRLIAEYCPPGGLVVDPMCGIGTTLVEAAALGRRAVGVELEPRWAELARANLAHALPPTGRPAEVRLGDARQLPELLADLAGRVDLVVTSPPYACEAGVIDKPAWRAGQPLCPRDTLNYSRDPANLGRARGPGWRPAIGRGAGRLRPAAAPRWAAGHRDQEHPPRRSPE